MVLSSCDQDMMHGVVSPVVGVGLLYRLQYTGESDTSRPAYVGRYVEIIILRYPIEMFGVGCQIVQLMQPPDSSNSASRQGAFGV